MVVFHSTLVVLSGAAVFYGLRRGWYAAAAGDAAFLVLNALCLLYLSH